MWIYGCFAPILQQIVGRERQHHLQQSAPFYTAPIFPQFANILQQFAPIYSSLQAGKGSHFTAVCTHFTQLHFTQQPFYSNLHPFYTAPFYTSPILQQFAPILHSTHFTQQFAGRERQ
jgi:hypothetical protein